MLIDSRYNVYKLAQVTGAKFLAFLAASAAVGYVAATLDVERFLFPTQIVGIFVAAVSIFLAFRINVGYSRWWLAREVWGGLVNESRSLGLFAVTMLRSGDIPTEAERERHRRITYRHIGFINALRLQLRRQDPADWETEIWERRINGRPLFSADEMARLKASANVATQVIALQGEDIAGYFDHSGDRRQVRMSVILRELYIRQGQSEAIKNTVLAWGYVYYTKILTWVLAVTVVFSQLNGHSVAGTALVACIATIFLTIEQVGRNLDNPFENTFNDTPLSSLCRSIEIDMLQQIGEPCDLAPLAPMDGRLD